MTAPAAPYATTRRAFPTRVIWASALFLCIVATLEGAALALLTPAKAVNAQVELVDQKTRAASALSPSLADARTPAVTRAFLMQYLRARETFDDTDIRQNYAQVIAWSAPSVANEYRRTMARDNPESPLSQYPARSIVSTTLKTIVILSEGSALIRYDLLRQDGANRPSRPTSYTAIISFGFDTRAAKDARMNPLGFRVTRYARTPDANSLQLLSGGNP